MKANYIILSTIIAALPFAANATNISGDMYVAPLDEDIDHPAPTTDGGVPFGRIDIDTDDQEHIATTAYVKGAYNSTIAAVNRAYLDAVTLIDEKQNNLTTTVNNQSQNISSTVAQIVNTTTPSATTLVSEAAIAGAMNNYATNSALNSKRVTIYTTWGVDDGTAVTQVPFSTAQ